MTRAKQALGRQRKTRIQRSLTVALDAAQQLRDAIRETGKKGVLGLSALTMAATLLTGSAYALPRGGELKAGSSTFSRPNARTLEITQSTKKSILNWKSYSIDKGEAVRYIQPSSSAISLNRVTGSDPSRLCGSLSANGQVWLINPNGVLVGPHAKISVGGFLASTLNLADRDFLGGNYSFQSSASLGGILNQGKIQGGYVALLSPSVANEGTIQASQGTAALASGDQVLVHFAGNDLVGFVVDPGKAAAEIRNSGTLSGNSVLLTARGVSDVLRSVVNNTGVMKARSIEERNGEIVLAGDEVTSTGLLDASGKQGGTIRIDGGFVSLGGTISADGRTQGGNISVHSSGTLSLADQLQARGFEGTGGQVNCSSSGRTLATSTSVADVSGATGGGSIRLEAQGGLLSSGTYRASAATGPGGRIDLSGSSVRLFSAVVDASGGNRGGLVRIGGAFQGGKDSGPSRAYNEGFLERWGNLETLSNAENVFVNDTASIDVSADHTGSAGGTAVVWSNKETTMLGRISAGGQASGGYVEVSSAERLRRADILKIDTGRGGELLLDPKNIVIGGSDELSNWTYQGILGLGYGENKDVDVNSLEADDSFGVSVSLNDDGDRLAVGADWDNGQDNSVAASGAVHLFSFSDTNFSGGSLQGIIGKGYAGGKNVNVSSLEAEDFFGRSLSLNGSGNRLAVGAYGDDGADNGTLDSGAVYLFNFLDRDFSDGSLQGIIGKGYAGDRDVDVAHLASGDSFGISASLNKSGNRLAVGAYGDDGADESTEDSGAVYLFSFLDTDFSSGSLQGIIGKGYGGDRDVDVARLASGDSFGISASLNGSGDRLAVGAEGDDGAEDDTEDGGAAYLFSFSDTDFSGGRLQGIIGRGYGGDKDVDVADLENYDNFGVSVSLNNTGNRLAVGADWDDGFENTSEDSGAVYLFSFSATDFNGGSLQGIMGKGYSGGKDSDVGILDDGDYFGRSVSLNGAGNLLAVGAWGNDGADESETDSGAVYLFSKYAFGDSSGASVNLPADDVATWLGGGSNLTLQASNDITLNSSITVNNPSGNGGDLTLAAGRSVILNGDITTDSSNLNLVANDTTANGVVDADREEGPAVIFQAPGTLIDAGTGAVTVSLRNGSGKTYTESGDITLSGINAATLSVSNAGLTAGSGVTQNGGSFIVTGKASLATGTNDIDLTASGNDFETVSATGRNVALVDSTGINLSTTTASGALSVRAGGDITDSGKVSVSGKTTLNSGESDIVLNYGKSDYGTVSATGRNVTLVDSTGINLSTTTASGALSVRAGGDITDSGKVSVSGKTTLNSGESDIVLNYGKSDYGTVSAIGRNVTLVDSTGINLTTTTASGALSVRAGGDITDSGRISVSGTTTLNAGTHDIVLNTSTNDFSKVIVKAGKKLTLVDADDLNLGGSTLSGAVTVTSHGSLTLLGSLNAGTNRVTLNAGSGAINGAYTLTAGNATLSGSTIGTAARPYVNASGLLTLKASSLVNGVSANLRGPADLDVVVSSAPGKVLLNGKGIYP
ncbi:MAG: Heme/hemopexin-binding protein precursor [Syntrophus sp. PtaU1.Bin005]|nr:MAG: Heme/hemopexin-binding protein precursor [Syntrophus sp. PtaU1.Bin005]